MVEGLLVIIHIIGIVILIPLLVLAPKTGGGSPLVTFDNPNGWASDALAVLVGSSAPLSTLIGFDCSIHMGMLIP
jgi:hypothetical protein